MKNIFAIFKDDMKGLCRNFLALVIALGLCVLPSLYAWFNIYSNWDPYANTSEVPIAIVSLDKGFEKTDGTYVNMGDTVIDNLHENDKLGWQFPKNEEEAIAGVYSGEYYASMVIGEDFSESMYDCLAKGLEHPTIAYYENEKKNAIAVKITDTGSSSLQSSINTEFVNVLVTSLSEHINEFASNEGQNAFSTIQDRIANVNDNLLAYESLLSSFVDCNLALVDAVSGLKGVVPQIQQSINSSIYNVNSAKNQAGNAADTIGKVTDSVVTGSVAAENVLDEATITAISTALTTANNYYSAMLNADTTAVAAQNAADAAKSYQYIASIADAVGLTKIATAANTVAKAYNTVSQAYAKQWEAGIKVPTQNAVASAALQQINKQIPTINEQLTTVAKTINEAKGSVKTGSVDEVVDSVNRVTKPTASVDLDADGIELLLDGVCETLLAANVALINSQDMLGGTTTKLTAILDKLDGVSETEQYQKLMEILQEDPAIYGSFISQPVEVKTIPVYETATYGSAVAPFYTVLALWVGVLILTALIKTRAVPKGSYENATNAELYFGRFLIFFVLGQLQSLITVWGDLHIIGVQCEDVKLFYLAGAVTSFTFTLLIYTLTISFGDIGKAFAVVVMVIQIAGSSGTYPIELLPKVFSAIYTYFPFPYAINAVREIISGRYENDYWIFLGQLLIFAVASIVVGLFIRKPFMKVNHYIEERMEDTHMM